MSWLPEAARRAEELSLATEGLLITLEIRPHFIQIRGTDSTEATRRSYERLVTWADLSRANANVLTPAVELVAHQLAN
jgi:hypothetical protein